MNRAASANSDWLVFDDGAFVRKSSITAVIVNGGGSGIFELPFVQIIHSGGLSHAVERDSRDLAEEYAEEIRRQLCG